MAEEASNATFDLVSSQDGTRVAVNRGFLMATSSVIRRLVQGDANTTERLVDTSGAALSLLASYVNHHRGVEGPIINPPLTSTVMREVVSDPWDADFIDAAPKPNQRLYDLMQAAFLLGLKPLLHLAAAKVGSLAKGKPMDQLKIILSAAAHH